MVHVIFYAGMRAATVSKKIPAIDRRFPSYSVAAGYGEKDISAILDDPEMLRNKRKIRTCIDNARKFAEVVTEYGSFAEYLRKIESVEDLWTDLHKQKTGKQKTDLYKQKRFKFLGRIISFHYLMEVGYDLVKPDIVLARVFSRLRLVNGLPNPLHPDPQKLTDEQLWQIVRVGQQIAKSTQLPIRYVDLVFAVFGQMEGQDPEGLPQGICLDEKPKCCRCEVRDFCRYEPKTLSAPL
jgi:DNA-3-methyladenine glycosylase I